MHNVDYRVSIPKSYQGLPTMVKSQLGKQKKFGWDWLWFQIFLIPGFVTQGKSAYVPQLWRPQSSIAADIKLSRGAWLTSSNSLREVQSSSMVKWMLANQVTESQF